MILWDDDQDKVLIDEKFFGLIEDIVEYSLREEGVKIPWELSITLVDNEAIREINNEFRHIDKATDVLSFPMLEYPEGKVFKECYAANEFSDADKDEDQLVLGDIVLSAEKAHEQGAEFGHGFLREACYLTVHSILHLMGYDHMEPGEKKRMRTREEEILDRFELSRGKTV